MSITPRTDAPSKNSRILFHLLTGATFNRFDAEKLGNHCLNSTISELANRHNLVITRQLEHVPNRWGKPCRVIRYGLPECEHNKASRLLAFLSRTDSPQLRTKAIPNTLTRLAGLAPVYLLKTASWFYGHPQAVDLLTLVAVAWIFTVEVLR